ncbi:MAG: VWA domain-containing protein [Saprospiraceae bacterium]|nr:VWA domain-containing protein [Saprospiraceae bacterium]
MFRIEESVYLFLFILLPVLYLLYSYAQRKNERTLVKLGELNLLRKLRLVVRDRASLKFFLFLSVIALTIVSLANPQFGKKKEKAKTQNIDVYLALDVSQSMLCQDIKPDRLSRAQLWIKQFIERFPSERFGFISFAGSAFLHTPLTTDLATIYNMVTAASPRNLGTQGTAIADAIQLAEKSFAKEEGFHKVIILLSDGEDHEGEIVESAQRAKESGITIFTIPLGTEQGGPIPSMYQGGSNFRTDPSGNLIITKPNRSLLKQIADAGGGDMFEIQSGDTGFETLRNKFNALARKEITYQSFSSFNSYFQYFLGLALLLLILETLMIRRKT